ncbi:MAG: helix-hairpin-helix domain-containing protein [Candidatus Roizmanbacteria bacterium]|nr:helix-hairpin-helix domain-containing protein [Candidatus Roizmanbacteria bacterium]
MQGFIESFKPFIMRYKSEVLLVGSAFLIRSISLVLFFQQKGGEQVPLVVPEKQETRTNVSKQTITVDISGAVKHPFVYTFHFPARIIDAIQKAGGLTEEADEAFVKRSVNYARIINDQEKIYIPFLSDTANGYLMENKRVIDYTQPNISSQQTTDNALININAASIIELDQLPGIGKVQSEAIFNNRPYTSIEDLVKNSVLKQSVYDKIKSLISVY